MSCAVDDLNQVRLLTGITSKQIPDPLLLEIMKLEADPLCAAAAAADRMAAQTIGVSAVTSVEDISLDRRRVVQGWQDLADRLRARCHAEAEEDSDDGPAVVEFAPWGPSGVEAVEYPWTI